MPHRLCRMTQRKILVCAGSLCDLRPPPRHNQNASVAFLVVCAFLCTVHIHFERNNSSNLIIFGINAKLWDSLNILMTNRKHFSLHIRNIRRNEKWRAFGCQLAKQSMFESHKLLRGGGGGGGKCDDKTEFLFIGHKSAYVIACVARHTILRARTTFSYEFLTSLFVRFFFLRF